MSLPMSEEQFAFVIWSNEYLDWDNYRDAFEEDYSGLSDDEKYQLMCDLNSDYLDDERRNLDVQVGTPIIVIADIGRWDGRHISSGCIKDCLESQLDGVTWYVDGKGDFRMDGYHHDGRNYYLYRKYREGIHEEMIDNFKEKILCHTLTAEDIDRVTEHLGDDIAKVYGFRLPEQRKSHERRDTR